MNKWFLYSNRNEFSSLFEYPKIMPQCTRNTKAFGAMRSKQFVSFKWSLLQDPDNEL